MARVEIVYDPDLKGYRVLVIGKTGSVVHDPGGFYSSRAAAQKLADTLISQALTACYGR